jgi:uncharacterized protein (UPF0179 family)
MPRLTLLPPSLAEPGRRFVFRGPNVPPGPNSGEECAACPYQKLCFGLEPGHAYVVKGKRTVTHPCELHEGGRVNVVEVEEVPFESSVERRHLRGTAAHWSPIACARPECPNYALCHPQGTQAGTRHQIVEAGEALACPAGFDLVRAKLRKMA